MYYINVIKGKFFISNTEDDKMMFGPFDSGSDAYFVREMLNKGILKMELKPSGKESIEDTNTVH